MIFFFINKHVLDVNAEEIPRAIGITRLLVYMHIDKPVRQRIDRFTEFEMAKIDRFLPAISIQRESTPMQSLLWRILRNLAEDCKKLELD